MKLDLSCLEQFKASRLLTDSSASGSPMEVALDLIDFDPLQPSRTLKEATLPELVDSIRAQGVLERCRCSVVPVPGFVDERVIRMRR